jgi:uncharacterized membrane protein (DUF485 family)
MENLSRDASDRATMISSYILAVINGFVIVQGFYSFWLKMKGATNKWNWKVIFFYGAALSCLIVAEIYFVSSLFMKRKCAIDFVQTYPAFGYLVTSMVYMM